MLGICYGHQLLAYTAGGHVTPQVQREYGRTTVQFAANPLYRSQVDSFVWMSHGDSVTDLPAEWITIASSDRCPCAAMMHREKPLFGVQFHPESSHTYDGTRLLRNFAVNICGAPQKYTPADLMVDLHDIIRAAAGPDDDILVACSLGVDSTTVAKLCQDAVGAERVHPVFINTGLLRQEDLEIVAMGKRLLPNLQVIDAQPIFLNRLDSIADPEEKRRIVGTTFWEVFAQEAKRLGERFPIRIFSQGTISPDVIESGVSSGQTAVIKSHHNLVARPDDFPFTSFEPLRNFWLFKDQVRQLAKGIDVPEECADRHPFPGPGLAVRISGVFTADRLRIARHVDAIWMEEIRRHGLYQAIDQAGATVLNDQSVCQLGDSRASLWTISLWAYTTEDFMTADVPPLATIYPPIERAAARISREVPGAGRVQWNLTSKPPGTIEWE